MATAFEALMECFRSCREEILARTKTRDGYIKLQLFVQAVFMALAEGVKFGGVASTQQVPKVLLLSAPVSFIFWLLYYMDDRLCAQLAKYSRRVLSELQSIHKGTAVLCFDASEEVVGYLRVRVISRFILTLVVFVSLPTILLVTYISKTSISSMNWPDRIFVGVEFVVIVVILIWAFRDFRNRSEQREDITDSIEEMTEKAEKVIEQVAS